MQFPSVPLPTWQRSKQREYSSSPPPPLVRSAPILGNDSFGLPTNDPDPFGVQALEEAGFEIKEAGTNSRPPSNAFAYTPSPKSPIFSTYIHCRTQSIDEITKRDVRRDSKRSTISVDHGTQTADLGPLTVAGSPSNSPIVKATENLSWTINEDAGEQDEVQGPTDLAEPDEVLAEEEHVELLEDESEVIVEEPVTVQLVAQAGAAPIVSRARLVTIPKRIPPPLPPRNPYRNRLGNITHTDSSSQSFSEEEREQSQDPEDEQEYQHSSQYSSRVTSPAKSGFDANSLESPNPWSETSATEEEPEAKAESINRKDEPATVEVDVDILEDKAAMDYDEFHSIPSTPIETIESRSEPIQISRAGQ